MNYQKIKTNEYDIHIINNKKFHTIDCRIYFTENVNKELITYRNALISVLTYATKKYDTKEKLMKRCQDLYSLSPVDPEGLLGTLSAIAHTLIGFYCGNIIQNNKEYKDKALSILIIGACLFITGYLFHYLLPLNKTIWSPSFAILTCGVAASLLGILIYVIDIKGKQNWSKPLLVFGINPLFLYLFSEFLNAFFRATGISECIFEIFNLYLNSYNSSLVHSLILVFLCWVIGYILYKKNIYIKI